jgi:glycosyltransferase involved in cell wall biosynthesis
VGGDISRADITQEIFFGGMSAASPVLVDAAPRPRKRLHVLTLTPFYPSGDDDAQGCFISEPLREMKELEITNSVFAVRPFYRGRARPSASAPSAQWKPYLSLPGGVGLPISGASLFASIFQTVRRIHQRHSIDLIHAHSALPCGHAASLLSRQLGIPFVITVHGLDAFFTNQVRGYAGKWCKRISQQVYRSARAVVCISQRVCEEVKRNTDGPPSTAVVYNGVDPDIFYPELDSLPSSVILSVGNLIPSKGHELLLRAFGTIEQRHPTLRCEIIGDGSQRSRLSELSSQLGIARKVSFLGRQTRTQVADAMRRCMVFALPSHYEGLGCVYLEAMSAGKPVIACRGQGIEEIIQHGTNGFLIDPGDVQSLGSIISTLLADPQLREDIGRHARRMILQSLTLAHQAKRLEQIYRGSLA